MKYVILLISILFLFQLSAEAQTITSFSPSSGPVGTLVTITGSNLVNPTSFTIGGVNAIITSNSGSQLVAVVMPGAVTGAVSIKTALGTSTASGSFTITPTPFPSVQQGNKLVGAGYIGTSYQGPVSISADGNTAIMGGSGDNNSVGAVWIYTRSGGAWTQQGNKLVGTGATGTAAQGFSVSISADGNTAIVGGIADSSDRGAAWIFIRTGGVWTQQGNKLVGTGGVNSIYGERQGSSVSISADGNTAIVGGSSDNSQVGAAWIYTRSGGVWTQQGGKLVGSGTIGTSFQGNAVSISADGNTAVIGGAQDNSDIGAVWIYTRSGGMWTQQGNKITAGVTAPGLGASVSLSADGNSVIAGASINGDFGSALVYRRSGSVWTQDGSPLVGTGVIGTAYQGNSVSISADGNTAVVGGDYDNTQIGAVWVYIRLNGIWTQQGNKLIGTGAVNGSFGARQGTSISISADGSTLIESGLADNLSVGAAWTFINNGTTPLSAPPTISSFSPATGPVGTLVTIKGTYLKNPSAITIGGISAIVVSGTDSQFVAMVMPGTVAGVVSITTANGTIASSGSFTTTATLFPSVQQGSKIAGPTGTVNAPQLGAVSVSADGNTAIIGGQEDNEFAGAAWIYTRSGGVWTEQGNKLVGTGGASNAQQGNSVSISADGNTAIVGGQADNNDVGAAWIFTRSNGVWTQQGSKLIGTGTATAAEQGNSVSISADGNTAVIGGPDDNNYIGAAWIFTRSAGAWTQQGTKLVGTGATGNARQGTGVAISADGNTVVVGGGTDNSSAGALWVYTRSGTTWTQQGSKLTGTADVKAQLGYSVSLSADGNTGIAGGSSDNSNVGAAWVFTRSAGVWTQQGAKLVGTGAIGASEQGIVSISADGNTAIVGGEGDSSNHGAVWVYTRAGGVWTQQGTKLVGTGAVGALPFQGSYVCISADGTTALEAGTDDNSSNGAVWTFIPGAVACNDPSVPLLTAPSLINCGIQNSTLSIQSGSLNSAANWHWYTGTCGGTSLGSGTSVVVSPTVTTTYYARGEGGCVTPGNCATIVITVNPVPKVTVNPTTLCKNYSTTLSAVGSDTYTWTPSFGLSATSGSLITAALGATGTYTVTGTNSCGSTSVTIVETVIPPPAVTVNSITICYGSAGTLTASGSSAYTWKPSQGLSVTTGSSVIANPQGTTTYSVTVSNACGSSTATAAVTVNPLPTVTVKPITICQGVAGTLTASGLSATYTWLPSAGLSATTGASVTANPPATTTYTVTGTNSCGSTPTTVVVTVTPFPTITVNSLSICNGIGGILNAHGGSAYTWSPATGLSSTIDSTVTANPTVTTTYTLTGGTVCGTTTTTAVVSVNSMASVSVNSIAICKGAPGTLTANGATTYSWSPSTGLSAATGSSVTANPTVTTTYTVSGTSSCGTTTATAVVTVNPVYASSFTVPPAVCGTGTPVLVTYTGNALSTATYNWTYAGSTGGIPGATSQALTYAGTGTYTVTLSVGSGACGSSITSHTVVINAEPSSAFAAETPVCTGTPSELTYIGNTPGATYTWNFSGASGGIAGSPDQALTWANAGIYTPTLTVSANGCTSSISSVPVTVLGLYTSSFNAPSPVCVGAQANVTYTGNAPSNATYNWTYVGATGGIAGASSQALTYASSGTYTVTLSVGSGACQSTTTSHAIVVGNSLPTPVAIAGTNASATQLTANWNTVSGATGYFLDVSLNNSFSSFITGYNNLSVGNVTTYPVTGLTPGTTYYYRVRGGNSCGTGAGSNIITCATTACAALIAGTVSPASSIICPGTTKLLTLTGASGGTLQWQLSADNLSWSNVTTGGNASTYTTITIDGASKKYYRCISSNACYNVSSASAIVDVSSPTITVSASGITDKSVTLNWSPAGSGNYSAGYSGSSNATINNVTPPVTLTGLNPGGTYNFTITQTGLVGCSASGTLTGITTLCTAPTALKVTATTANSIAINWTGPVANYRIYYTQSFSSSVVTYTQDVTNANSATIASLLAGATYKIYVVQKDCPASGIIGQPSSFVYGTTSNTNTCATPTIDSVKSTCSGQIQIWLHGSASNQYIVYVQPFTPVLQAATSYTINGGNFSVNVTEGQSYLIAAASVCGGSAGNLASWQTPVAVSSTCNAVTNLLLSQPTCTGFTASWNADNCSSNNLDSYLLSIRKQGTIAWTSFTVLATTPLKTLTGLAQGAAYQCYVRSAYSCNGYDMYGPASQTQTISTQSSGCRTEDEAATTEETPVLLISTGNNESFSLYPNPNAGEFTIDLSQLNTEEESVRIEVLNMIGQTVLTHLTNITGGHLNEFIYLPNRTASGMYFVRVTAGKNVYTNKVNISK